MPAVAYAMSDLTPSADGRHSAGRISRPVHAGGCGQEHEVQVDAAGRAYVACDRCAPSLIAGHYGWASRPGDVPLTCDEVADQELAERDAKGAQNTLLKGMTEAFMKAIQGGTVFGETAKPKSVLEQITEMSPEERAALAAALMPAGAIPGAVEDAAPEGEGPALLTPPVPKGARVAQSQRKPRTVR
jgi:hypothetical protein